MATITVTRETTQSSTHVGYGLKALLATAVALYALTIVRTAWLCDDAYITFRTVDNFLHGYGLTWNVHERVQAYTHPLWMFVLSGFCYCTHEIYYTSIFVSMGISLAAVLVLVTRTARTVPQAILALCILIFSKAFVDFSTSGLENPLSYLLLAVFFTLYLQDGPIATSRLLWLSLTASLSMLNRMDMALLLCPALLQAWWATNPNTWQQANDCNEWAGPGNNGHIVVPSMSPTQDRQPLAAPPARGCRLAAIAAGFLPFIAWEVFSIIYYGFLFPNTAYAKLNTGISTKELAGQGLNYLRDSLTRDPLTVPAILCVVAAALALRQRKQAILAIGILLYLAYTIRIGGDFMSGRFLAVPLFCSVMVLGSLRWRPALWQLVPLLAIVVGLGFYGPSATICSGGDYGKPPTNRPKRSPYQIADERAVYYPCTGLLRAHDQTDQPDRKWIAGRPDHRWVEEGVAMRQAEQEVAIYASIGFRGYFAGPDVRIIDSLALSDPLLARLPAESIPNWRIGHFERLVPDGYAETVVSGQNCISDPNLWAYYDKLALITQGPLFSKDRWQAIWDMYRGKFDHLIDRQAYRFPGQVRIDLKQLASLSQHDSSSSQPAPEQLASASQPTTVRFPKSGILVRLGKMTKAPSVVLTLTDNSGYQVTWLHGNRELDKASTRTPKNSTGKATSFWLGTPGAAINKGYDALLIQPAGRSCECGLAKVQLKWGKSRNSSTRANP